VTNERFATEIFDSEESLQRAEDPSAKFGLERFAFTLRHILLLRDNSSIRLA